MDSAIDIITSSHPDYQHFKASDFSKLRDTELRTILCMFALKKHPETVVPQSFVKQYGDNAAAETLLAAQREALRRNKPEIYATGTLDGGFLVEANPLGKRSGIVINADVPATIALEGNITANSTAPKILNYIIAGNAQELIAKNELARRAGTYKPTTSFEVVIPPSVISAVVKANPAIPQNLAERPAAFTAGDELSFISGYATRAGASKDIGAVTMEYPQSAVCGVPKVIGEIFNSKKADVDAALAWAAGYIQSDVDQMPSAQRNQALAPCKEKMSAAR